MGRIEWGGDELPCMQTMVALGATASGACVINLPDGVYYGTNYPFVDSRGGTFLQPGGPVAIQEGLFNTEEV